MRTVPLLLGLPLVVYECLTAMHDEEVAIRSAALNALTRLVTELNLVASQGA